jgi:hypothetical protein
VFIKNIRRKKKMRKALKKLLNEDDPVDRAILDLMDEKKLKIKIVKLEGC